MASEEAAITMVNYYTTATPHVRNQPVYIQYSNHRELKTDNLPNQGVSTDILSNQGVSTDSVWPMRVLNGKTRILC